MGEIVVGISHQNPMSRGGLPGGRRWRFSNELFLTANYAIAARNCHGLVLT